MLSGAETATQNQLLNTESLHSAASLSPCDDVITGHSMNGGAAIVQPGSLTSERAVLLLNSDCLEFLSCDVITMEDSLLSWCCHGDGSGILMCQGIIDKK